MICLKHILNSSNSFKLKLSTFVSFYRPGNFEFHILLAGVCLHADSRHICTWFDMLAHKQTLFLINSEVLSGRSIVYIWCAIICTTPGADGLKI